MTILDFTIISLLRLKLLLLSPLWYFFPYSFHFTIFTTYYNHFTIISVYRLRYEGGFSTRMIDRYILSQVEPHTPKGIAMA